LSEGTKTEKLSTAGCHASVVSRHGCQPSGWRQPVKKTVRTLCVFSLTYNLRCLSPAIRGLLCTGGPPGGGERSTWMSLTQGGALTRFPWATFRGPFRAENWLSVRLSATLLSNEHDMGQR